MAKQNNRKTEKQPTQTPATEIRAVPVDQVTVPEVRVTAIYDEETLQLLKRSLNTAGTINPIIVVETETGYEVVDGLHRWEEALNRGDKTIDAVVYQGGPEESLMLNLILNKLRGKTRASEMVQVIGKLYHDHGLDSEAIQERTGLTRDYIERLMQISEASPSVLEALDAERIGVGHAFQVSRLPSFIQQDEVMAKYQVWRFTVRELQEQVDGVLRDMELLQSQPVAPPAASPPPRHPYFCEGCREEQALKDLRPVNLCPECFTQVWRIGRARLADQDIRNQEPGGG